MSQKCQLGAKNNANTVRIIKWFAGKGISYTWQGTLLEEGPALRKIRAFFSGEPGSIVEVNIEPGDKWIETYYNDRWYNVFQMYAGDSDTLKLVYFNISRPAVFKADSIEWEDLALDLAVLPDGSHHILDEDEFDALDLDAKTRQICWRTLEELLKTDMARFLK